VDLTLELTSFLSAIIVSTLRNYFHPKSIPAHTFG
jgi:hypothetical protein